MMLIHWNDHRMLLLFLVSHLISISGRHLNGNEFHRTLPEPSNGEKEYQKRGNDKELGFSREQTQNQRPVSSRRSRALKTSRAASNKGFSSHSYPLDARTNEEYKYNPESLKTSAAAPDRKTSARTNEKYKDNPTNLKTGNPSSSSTSLLGATSDTALSNEPLDKHDNMISVVYDVPLPKIRYLERGTLRNTNPKQLIQVLKDEGHPVYQQALREMRDRIGVAETSNLISYLKQDKSDSKSPEKHIREAALSNLSLEELKQMLYQHHPNYLDAKNVMIRKIGIEETSKIINKLNSHMRPVKLKSPEEEHGHDEQGREASLSRLPLREIRKMIFRRDLDGIRELIRRYGMETARELMERWVNIAEEKALAEDETG